MAVQAQYPSNVLFISRGEEERKDMEFPPVSTAFIDQSPLLFNNGGNGNSRKRVREAMAGVPVALSSTSHQSSTPPLPPPMMTVAQLQSNHYPNPSPLVSTGLRLAFEDNRQSNPLLLSTFNNTSSSVFSSLLSNDLAAQINQQKHEIEQLIVAQGEQLRRTLAEKRQRHLRALLCAAEESAARRLRDKEAELDRSTRRLAELEDRLTRLRTESMAWQMKAMADQATAASLHAQLQAAAAAAAQPAQTKANGGGAGDESGGSNRAEDAESAYVDPDRVEPARACRTCHCRPATVVVLPCRHLCVCDACEAAAGPVFLCPVCGAVRTGSVHVFMD